MENATKALLIAASVLIVIVLVAVGVLLIKNTSDTSEQAEMVGNAISSATGNASSDAIGGIKGSIISKKKFNSFINDLANKYTSANQFMETILNDQNVKLSNQIQIVGYVYQGKQSEYYSERTPELIELSKNFDSKNQQNNKEIFEYEINTWIPMLLNKDKLVRVNNPTDTSFKEIIENLKQVYENKTGKEATDDLIKSKSIYMKWSFGFDEWGYINKAVYITVMNF